MAEAVIPYDKDLPEIPDRQAHQLPIAYLRKKPGGGDEFEVVAERRPSKLLLVNRLREAVNAWRAAGYRGASSVTERLFTYWFEGDHLIDGRPFRYYFGQREAAETLIYLLEVQKIRDARALLDTFGEIFYPEGTQQRLPGSGLAHQTTMDGKRRSGGISRRSRGRRSRTCRRRTCAATPSKWPRARGRPSSWLYSWSGPTSTSA